MPWLQFLRDQYKHSAVDKCISPYKTYISEFLLRWPEIRSILWSHHYKAMRKCSNAFYPKIALYQATLDDPHAVLTQWPLFQVIRVHMRPKSCFASKFWYNKDRALWMVPMRTRIERYTTWPTWLTTWPHVTLTWGQILTLIFKGQQVYILTRLDERSTLVPKTCQ